MILVIFGAGASYDSVPTDVYANDLHTLALRPPLANEVFDNREAFRGARAEHPELRAISNRLLPFDDPHGFDLELALERLFNEREQYPQRHGQLLAVSMYLADIIRHCSDEWGSNVGTNYDALLDLLTPAWKMPNSEGVALVTFNYDTLLDQAVERATDYSPAFIGEFVQHTQLPLFKLHGSVNWRRRIGSSYVHVLENPKEHVEELDLRAPELGWWGEGENMAHRYVPSLAIPMREKDDFECPDEHVARLRDHVLPHVTKVLVIGWKGREAKFLELLRDGLTRYTPFVIVDQDAMRAHEVASYLYEQGVQERYRAFGGKGFSHFIRTGEMAHVLGDEPDRFRPGAEASAEYQRWTEKVGAGHSGFSNDFTP